MHGSNPIKGTRVFSPPKGPDQFLSPLTLLFNSYYSFFPEVQQTGHQVGLSPPSSADTNNEWSYNSATRARLHGVDNFTNAPFPITLISVVFR
jgi:hypothetical protein